MLLWTDSAQRLRSSSLMLRRGYTDGQITSWSATGGRSNGPMNTGFTTATPVNPAPSGSTFVMGYRFNMSATFWTAIYQCRLGATEQCSVRASGGTRIISVLRGGSVTLASSPAGTLPLDTLVYIAVKMVIHSSTGSVVVYMDGVEIPELTLTNVNTQGQATATWDGFGVGGYTGGSGMPWQDLYVLDGSQPHASDPANIITDARVDYCAANGNGYASQFTNDIGDSTDNYLSVDDTSPDDDTTHVQKLSAGIDGYTLANLPAAGSTIAGVCAFAHAGIFEAGVAYARTGLRSGGNNYAGTSKLMDYTNADAYQNYGHDPDNGAWTESAFNSTEVLLEKV